MKKKVAVMDKNTVFIFSGDGLCVVGLPPRLTKAEASEMGVLEILEAAIANGNYKPETGKTQHEEA